MSKLVYRTVQFLKKECEESWKIDHHKVMANYKSADCLGDAAQLFVSLYGQLRAATESESQDSFDGVIVLCDTLDLWYEAASELIAKIEESEGEEFQIESATALRSCHRDASLLLEDLHDAKNAIEAIRDGRSIGLQEFLDELRNPIHR